MSNQEYPTTAESDHSVTPHELYHIALDKAAEETTAEGMHAWIEVAIHAADLDWAERVRHSQGARQLASMEQHVREHFIQHNGEPQTADVSPHAGYR